MSIRRSLKYRNTGAQPTSDTITSGAHVPGTLTVPAASPTACIAVDRDGSAVTVRVAGRLTGAAVPVLRAALLRALPIPCTRLQIDAAQVETVGQDALAVLLAAVPWALAAGAEFGYESCPTWLRAFALSEDILGMFPMLPMRLAASVSVA
jgi:anti-anti-sigma regulatory factor